MTRSDWYKILEQEVKDYWDERCERLRAPSSKEAFIWWIRDEEDNDYFAQFQEWLLERKLLPSLYGYGGTTTGDGKEDWSYWPGEPIGVKENRGDYLCKELFDKVKRERKQEGWKGFSSLQNAEEALFNAWKEWREEKQERAKNESALVY